MPPVRVLLANRHWLMRSVLHALLDNLPDLSVVGTTTSPDNLLRDLDGLRPDVVVLDAYLMRTEGEELVTAVQTAAPRVLILVSDIISEGGQRAQTDLPAGITGVLWIDPSDLTISLNLTRENSARADVPSAPPLPPAGDPHNRLRPRRNGGRGALRCIQVRLSRSPKPADQDNRGVTAAPALVRGIGIRPRHGSAGPSTIDPCPSA